MEIVPATKPVRKRRAYKRSQQGCRNCKLRRVKCDETKPECRKCISYGVWCNFDPSAPDLEVSAGALHSSRAKAPAESSFQVAPVPSLSLAVTSSDGVASVELDTLCLQRLERFRSRTAPIMSNPEMLKNWEEKLLPLALKNPFLVHTILALTAIHDRYLTTPINSARSFPEAYHSLQSAELFNKKLSRGFEPEDRDPLWATAAFLSIISFASFDAASPDQAWPLQPPKATDLDWLRMGDGKMAIWHLTDPLRPGGLFRAMANDYAQVYTPIPVSGADGVPNTLAELCGMDALSSLENNPYFGPVHALVRFQKFSDEEITLVRALTFSAHMQGTFKNKLRDKDPVALLLLALWYAKARKAIWWIERRAIVECEAIRRYLKLFHSDDSRIMEMLSTLPAWF